MKRKIKGYMVFDSYEIFDITGDYTKTFWMYKGSKFLGMVKFA